MRLIATLAIAAAFLSISLLPASTQAVNSRTFIELTELQEGDVVVTGSHVDGACIAPDHETSIREPATGFFSVLTELNPTTCEEIVAEICTSLDMCPGVLDDSGLQSDSGIDLTTPSIRLTNCAKERTVHSAMYTYGYGGSTYDKLTRTRIDFTFGYSCSSGRAEAGTYSGFCDYASWNGWQVNSCLYYTPGLQYGEAGRGTTGSFECHNNNFCFSRDYAHSLWAGVIGWNSGGYNCQHMDSGEMPPFKRKVCNLPSSVV